jgi:hypothetical protein
MMNKVIATTVAALMLAGLSFGATVPAMAASHPVHHVAVVAHHSAHWHMHQRCKTVLRHHHHVKVCTWVKN